MSTQLCSDVLHSKHDYWYYSHSSARYGDMSCDDWGLSRLTIDLSSLIQCNVRGCGCVCIPVSPGSTCPLSMLCIVLVLSIVLQPSSMKFSTSHPRWHSFCKCCAACWVCCHVVLLFSCFLFLVFFFYILGSSMCQIGLCTGAFCIVLNPEWWNWETLMYQPWKGLKNLTSWGITFA